MITAIIQARMGSSRLPQKVMKPLAGKPLLAHVIERVKAATHIEQVILATSDAPADKALRDLADEMDIKAFAGSETDVLDRYYQAAVKFKASSIVRITGDCPVIDPIIIDQVIRLFQSGDYDYACNIFERTYPDGLDTEVFSFDVLKTAWHEATLKSEREHVTPFIRKSPDRFHLIGLTSAVDFSYLRWTVDEPVDYDYMKQIFDTLYANDPLFDMQQHLALLQEKPALKSINQGIPTNEGYQKSIAAETTSKTATSEFTATQSDILRAAVGLIASEFSAPVNAIKGYAAILARQESYVDSTLSPEQQQGVAQTIYNELTTFDRLIENLLEQVTVPQREPQDKRQTDIVEALLDTARTKTFYDEVRTFVHEALIPLTSIRGFGSLMIKEIDGQVRLSQVEKREFLGNIVNGGISLAHYILNMGEIVRFEKDPTLEFKGVIPAEMLNAISERLHKRIIDEKRDLSLSVSAEYTLPPMRADQERIHRVLQRLADNAFAYTEDGGCIELSAQYDDKNDVIVLSVYDSGIGIDDEAKPNIFRRYYRGKHPNIAGSGMGLSIAKMYVDAQGGQIWFESNADGTTFYVRMPIMKL